MAIIFGTNGSDFLFGNDSAQDIRGSDGNDTIIGVGGDDSVYGNQDNDFISGNLGNDQVFGGQGDDLVVGGQGNDTLNGNIGNDQVNGNIGDDFVFGGQGNDTVRGGQGNDIISGDLGNDLIFGDLGNDTLSGGEGFDAFVIDSRDSRVAVITDFLPSQDYIALDGDLQPPGSTTGTAIVLAQVGSNTTISVGDRLIATLLNVTSTSLTAGNFTRTLTSPTAAPTNSGGITVGNIITGTSGNDTISDPSSAGVTGATNVNPAASRNIATSLADVIDGAGGNDLIFGLGGNDTIQAGSGNDTITGGLGNDSLNGSSGIDVIIWNDGDGSDTVEGGDDNDQLTVNLSANADLLAIAAQGSRVSLNQTGSSAFSLDLNSVEQIFVNGGNGNDSISGSLSPATSSLSLNGDAGNDTLIGGLGNDLLTGGENGDLFVISRNTGADTIVDFVKGTDLIGLAGGLTSNDLIISSAASNITTISASGSVIATLLGVSASSFTSSDFVPFTIVNPTPSSGTFNFSAAAFSVNENGTAIAAVTVNRTVSTIGALSVVVTPTDGTATGGTAPLAGSSDYDNAAITVNFADGETSRVVNIPIFDDAIAEANETINLTLTALTGATIGSQNAATLTIVDNDSSGALAFSRSNFSVNEDGVAINAVTVTRTGTTTNAVGATINLTNGTATGGSTPLFTPSDYGNAAIAINFAPGETSRVIAIPVLDDNAAEPEETVNLTLTNPTGGATIGSQSSAVLSILDNDSTTVTIAATDPNASESNTDSGTYTFTRTGLVSNPLTVNFQITGSATGADYNAIPGTVVNGTSLTGSIVIPVGSSAVTLNLLPIDDTIPDGGALAANETVIATLISGVGYNIGSANNATITIGDNDASSNNDPLLGADSNDLLNGLSGIDTINGGAGNDSLIGGAGADLLTGGLGNDFFIYTAPTELGDQVSDFVSGSDRFIFDIVAFGFTGNSVGALPASRFALVTTYADNLAPSGTSSAFAYEASTKRLLFDNNGTTSGGINVVATLDSGSVGLSDIQLFNS